jgi:hypothetical protein
MYYSITYFSDHHDRVLLTSLCFEKSYSLKILGMITFRGEKKLNENLTPACYFTVRMPAPPCLKSFTPFPPWWSCAASGTTCGQVRPRQAADFWSGRCPLWPRRRRTTAGRNLSARDRFYECPFRPKNFSINFPPLISDTQSSTQNHTYIYVRKM